MTTDIPTFSDGFQRLYCQASAYAPFSTFHPISFARVLPFQPQDQVVDDERLIATEQAHLADRNVNTRREVIEAYAGCGLLPDEDADNVKSVIDFYDGADFFELMGLVYANAGIHICALRWYHEFIRDLETQTPNSCSDQESIYASVGYCLYSLGLFAEAISWSKSCIGPDQLTDVVCQALLGYEMKLVGGTALAIERAAGRTRHTVSAPVEAAQASESTARLEAAMKAFAPAQEIYFDWTNQDTPRPETQPEGYPFRVERDASDLPRHKMNLIFATCGQADALVEKGHPVEAKRLLFEAAILEPEASFVWDRIKSLP
jgi:tetratricopeptide (TPR) repeat protein